MAAPTSSDNAAPPFEYTHTQLNVLDTYVSTAGTCLFNNKICSPNLLQNLRHVANWNLMAVVELVMEELDWQ